MSHRTRTVVRGRVGTWVPLDELSQDQTAGLMGGRRFRTAYERLAVSDLDTDRLARRQCWCPDRHPGEACLPAF